MEKETTVNQVVRSLARTFAEELLATLRESDLEDLLQSSRLGGKQEPKSRLISVTQWNRFHSSPPIGGLRYLIFNAERNGFSACLRRMGRRLYIDEAAFFEWASKSPHTNHRGPWKSGLKK